MIVEDGTIVSGANSFCTVAFADSYFATRGVVEWVGSNTVKEQALIKATDYIELVYSDKFKSYILSDTQLLSFPRELYGHIVPDGIKKANCELALRSLVSNLIIDVSSESSVSRLKKKVVTIGPMVTSTEFATGITNSGVVNISKVNLMIRPFINSYNGVLRG